MAEVPIILVAVGVLVVPRIGDPAVVPIGAALAEAEVVLMVAEPAEAGNLPNLMISLLCKFLRMGCM